MLQKIAEVTGFPFTTDENDPVFKILKRIEAKIAPGTDPNHPAIRAIIEKAEEDVNREGQFAIATLVKQIIAPPPEKVLKIKSSPKGARIKVAAANGVRFSFGPIWNESVKKAKGIAVVEANRAKLNHQGLMVGIENPEKMEVGALCAAISATF